MQVEISMIMHSVEIIICRFFDKERNVGLLERNTFILLKLKKGDFISLCIFQSMGRIKKTCEVGDVDQNRNFSMEDKFLDLIFLTESS